MKANRKSRENRGVTPVLGTLLTIPIAIMIVSATMVWANSLLDQINGFDENLDEIKPDEGKIDLKELNLQLEETVFYKDDFEGEKLQWNVLQGSVLPYKSEYYHTRGHSAELIGECMMEKPFGWEPFRNVSIEIYFTLNSKDETKIFNITNERNGSKGSIKLEKLDDWGSTQIYVWNDSSWNHVDTDSLYAHPNCWHHIRLKVDLNSSKYVSFDLNGETYDLSSYGLNETSILSDSIKVSFYQNSSVSSFVDDFVFREISRMTEYNESNSGVDSYPPTADAGGPYTAIIDETITFNASESKDNDENGENITSYRWDWTNDEIYDTDWLTSNTTTHAYSSIGTYTVKLQVKDDEGQVDDDTVEVDVNQENVPILRNPDPADEETGVLLSKDNVSVDIEDGDGEQMEWYIDVNNSDSNSANCRNSTISCSLTLPLSPSTTYTWWVNVTDGTSWTNETYSFTTGNIAPTANDDEAETYENNAIWIDVLANDSDTGGTLDPSTVQVTSDPSHGNTSVNYSTGEIEYTPDSNYVGTDSFTYTVDDDNGETSNLATVTIDVITPATWPMFQHHIEHTGFISESGEIGNPSIKWSFLAGLDSSCGDQDTQIISRDVDGDGEIEVILSNSSSDLYCINGATGNQEWIFSAGGEEPAKSSPAAGDVDNDGDIEVLAVYGYTVVNGSWEAGRLYCINGATGNKEWETDLNFRCADSDPIFTDIENDGSIEIFVGSCMGPSIYSINGSTGNTIWSKEIDDGWCLGSPVIGSQDKSSLYYTTDGDWADPDGILYKLNSSNGNKIWETNLGGGVYSSPALDEGNGKLYVPATVNSNYISCIDTENGNELWNFTTGDEIHSSPAIADIDNDGETEVIIGSDNDFVYCLDGNSGVEEWNFNVNGAVKNSPVTADIDGDGELEVIVGSNDDNIYCIDKNGNQEWKHEVEDPIGMTVGDVDLDGKLEIVVGSNDNKLYCLDG
ncbi:MAG: PQQ-binding-like beta-propeller repeat protein [Candidatus Thermoplasmatota archaeon]